MFSSQYCAAILLLTGFLSLSFPASAQNLLGKTELNSLIFGNTVHTENLEHGRSYLAYHRSDGQIEYEGQDGETFGGIWWIRADGTHCVIISHETCARIQKNSDGTYTRLVDGVPWNKWAEISTGKAF